MHPDTMGCLNGSDMFLSQWESTVTEACTYKLHINSESKIGKSEVMDWDWSILSLTAPEFYPVLNLCLLCVHKSLRITWDFE